MAPNLCTRCDVVEESMTHILREPTINGHDVREIIRFDLEEKVLFFQDSGRAKA